MLRSNLLKREGPCFSRSRSRPTQVDSVEPLVSSSGCAFSSDSVVPRHRDREDSNDEEVLQLSMLVTPVSHPASLMPTWVDSPEDPRPRVLQAVSSPTGRKPPRVYDLTEVDSEDDSDHDSGPESFVFNPVESDDDLDSVIDALERDLEDDGASVLQPAVEDVQEVALQVDKQDIPVGVGIRPRSRSIEFPDGSCAVLASGACASATLEGRVASFADRGVKRLRVIPRLSVALGSELATDEHRPSAGETLIDHPSEFPEDDMSDTQSVVSRGGHSEGDPDSEVAPAPDPVPAITGHLKSLSASFEWLASVDLETVFSQRVCVMKAVPGFMRGAYRSAMRFALADIDEGRAHNVNMRMSRDWNSSCCFPDCFCSGLLGGKIPKA